jgi:hypothetical protein
MPINIWTVSILLFCQVCLEMWTNTEDYQTNTPQVNWGISQDTIINLELR